MTVRPAHLTVALDLTPAIAGTTGVARYVHQLRDALVAVDDLTVRPFAIGRGIAPVPPGVAHLRVPLRVVRRSWQWTGRPRAEHFAPDADVVHSTDLVPPPTRRPLVVTVHDLSALSRPDLHPEWVIAEQAAKLAALDRAAAVIADSQATADELVRRGIAAERIEVVLLGVTPSAAPQPVSGAPGRFALAIGTLNPRKGFDVLLRAIAQLDDIDLLIAGPDTGEGPALAALADELGIAHRYRSLGQVSDGQLAWLLQHAAVFAFPSRDEGFGLPVLEALAAGVPTVASDLAVIRETAGDAALLVPPDNPPALADGLRAALEDAGTRRRLTEDGPRRAERFTWATTAEQTAAVYRRAARRP